MIPLNRSELMQRINARLHAGKRPYSVRNADGADGRPAELRIYTEVGIWGITEEEFAAELAEVTAKELLVSVSSPGGDVFSGIAIYNALRQHPARVTTRVDSLAASIASVIVQAGDHRVMVSHSQMMIHQAWGLMIGTANDMAEFAKLLDRQTDVIAGIYADHGSKSKRTYLEMMHSETWFTTAEAAAAGLIDEIREPAGHSQNRSWSPQSDEDRTLLARAEHEIWVAEIEEIAQRLELEELREIANRHLEYDPRDQLAYVEVDAHHVPAATREAASLTLAAAAADLGLAGPPNLRWFRQARSDETPTFTNSPIYGAHYAGDIWLKVGLADDRLRAVVRHEAAHAAGKDELDAQYYEETA